MSGNSAYFECNEPSVIFERFDDETILINLDRGQYYSLDPLAAVVWQLLTEGDSLGAACERIAAHYGDDAAKVTPAISELVERMVGEELLRRTDTAPGPGEGSIDLPTAGGFAEPKIAQYDDMQEMLLLDPVHDVEDSGWPAAAAPAAEADDDDAASWQSVKTKS